jgi:serine/threonine protein kinase
MDATALGPGEELAGYRIARELGRGGMGVVYEAEHLQLGRSAVLKVLAPHLAGDGAFRERFVEESRLVAAIDHPNIVPIYDAGEVGAVLYIAMRYVEGADLKTLLARDGPLDPELAAGLVEQAAAALDAAHARDLVHRDVKPANILVEGAGGRVILTDFGVARGPRADAAAESGLFLGTVDYASPEQLQGERVTAATDVYALGCVLFECLTGRPPFDRETDVAVVYAHLLDPPPRVGEHRLDAVIARALAKSPDERYESCGALASAARAGVAVS